MLIHVVFNGEHDFQRTLSFAAADIGFLLRYQAETSGNDQISPVSTDRV